MTPNRGNRPETRRWDRRSGYRAPRFSEMPGFGRLGRGGTGLLACGFGVFFVLDGTFLATGGIPQHDDYTDDFCGQE